MISLIFACLITLTPNPTEPTVSWKMTDTGIFRTLSPQLVEVGANGNIFILDFDEARILHLNSDGEIVNVIGRKGRGPGEFSFPTMIFSDDEHLFVFDAHGGRFSTFNYYGDFLGWGSLSRPAMEIRRFSSGWVFIEPDLHGLVGGAQRLQWADESFKSIQTLQTIAGESFIAGMSTTEEDGKKRGVFTPISVRSIPLVNRAKDKLFVSHPEHFKIDVYETGSLTLVRTITRDYQRLPFDDEWAKRKLDQKVKNSTDLKGVPVELAVPERFPAIRSMQWDLDGNLLISLWRGNPDKTQNFITLDQAGKEQPTSLSPAVLSRVVGSLGGSLIVTVFPEDTAEAGLAKIKREHLEQFLEQNPIQSEEGDRKVHVRN